MLFNQQAHSKFVFLKERINKKMKKLQKLKVNIYNIMYAYYKIYIKKNLLQICVFYYLRNMHNIQMFLCILHVQYF